ncbi:MAG: hypothetical protein D6785_01625 [Planctomycetota bacterium]|nr:MAG: hypothetical protein D6785_01625 [Planctomycetota bacterium]
MSSSKAEVSKGPTTLFEMERVQESKVWLFFGTILLFYVISVMIFAFALILFSVFIDLRLTQVLMNNLQVSILVLFAFSFLFSLIHWQISLKKGPQKILDCMDAYPPDPEDRYHQVYKNVVEEMAIAFGQNNFHAMVFPSPSINSVTISTMDGEGYLVMAEGAISRLNRAQLQAFVAQGVARCATGEAQLTTMACSLSGVYETVIEKLDQLAKKRGNNDSNLFVKNQKKDPLVGVIGIGFLQFVVVILHMIFMAFNMALSRENGLLADAVAVRLTRNPLALAEALYIAHHNWKGGAVKNGIEPLYALPPGRARSFDEPDGNDIFATHPPIQKRVSILLDMAHATRDALDKALQDSMRPIPIQESNQEEEKEEYYVKMGQEWKGPLSSRQLLNLPGLTSESWIGLGNKKNILPLFSIPKLARQFQENTKGSKWKCPKCKKDLRISEKSGLKIHQCSSCKGFLVSQDKIIRVITRREGEFPSQILKMVEELPSWEEVKKRNQNQEFTHSCPQCKQRMIRKPYNLVYPIEIDQCNLCKWTWFDEKELEMLQYLVQKGLRESQKWL